MSALDDIQQFHANNFRNIKELGSGRYSKVFLSNYILENRNVAIKWFSKSVSPEMVCREVENQNKCSCSHVTPILGIVNDDNGSLGLMMSPGSCDLLTYLESNTPLSEGKLFEWFHPIFVDLEKIHQKGVIHNDIKLENIVIYESDKQSKDSPSMLSLIDFGLSEDLLTSNAMNSITGTPNYLAPEIFKHQIHSSKADVWSLGIVLFCCLTKQFPFEGNTNYSYMCSVLSDNPKLQLLEKANVSEECINLINSMLEKNPNDRPSIEECLSMKWFKKNIFKIS